MTTVTEKSSATGAVTKRVEFVYDAFDRRVAKRIDNDGNGTWDRYDAWLWDGQDEIEQFRDSDGQGTGQGFRISNRYLFGGNVDELLSDEQYTGNTGFALGSTTPSTTAGNTLWALTDHLGSVRDVVENNGVIRQHVVYDGFGRRLREVDYNAAGAVIAGTDPAAIDVLFGYTGRDWDADVALQYNRARWYDPATGRWTSRDPIGFAAGDGNLYRYVGNGATGATDPSGLENYVPRTERLPETTLGQWWWIAKETYYAYSDSSVRIVTRTGEGIAEMGRQFYDAGGSLVEIGSFGNYRHSDVSQTLQMLASGQVSTGSYYARTAPAIVTVGISEQLIASYELYEGSIDENEFATRVGSTGLTQLGAAYLMSRTTQPNIPNINPIETPLSPNALVRLSENAPLAKALEYARNNNIEGRCVEVAEGPNGLHAGVSGAKTFPKFLIRPSGVRRTCAMPKAVAGSGLPAEISCGGVFVRPSGVSYADICPGCWQVIVANPSLRVGPAFKPVTTLEYIGSKPIYPIPVQRNNE